MITDTLRRVLIVDDQRSIHEDFRKILECKGHSDTNALSSLEEELLGTPKEARPSLHQFSVDSAFQGREALDLVRAAVQSREPYDLAFVDMRMPPGWDGMETCKRLWEADGNLQIVICTAYSDYSWSEIVEGLGHTDRLLLLRKPFDPNEAWQLAVSLSEKQRLLRASAMRMTELESLSGSLANANNLLRDEISTREAVEDRLRHMATHDSLTGLLNRVNLSEAIEKALARSNEDGLEVAVIFFDLDDFKLVNDSMGHEQGDRLLLDVGRAMTEALDQGIMDGGIEEHLAFRMGGDEFVVVLRTRLGSMEVEALCGRLQQSVMAPRSLGEKALAITMSAGLSLAGGREVLPEALLREADTALYRAKLNGRGYLAKFDDEMHESVVRRLQIESDLKRSTIDGDFTLVYQPIFHSHTHGLAGFEALLRWRLSDGTTVGPGEFIPIAERSGIIGKIGRWVLREAASQVAEWNGLRSDMPPLSINVNVSRRQVEDPDFLADLESLALSTEFDPKWINLEITETAAIQNLEGVIRGLRRYRALGFGVQMDDFGTGYSSLSCLHQLPLDVVKIDRDFVAAMGDREECKEIIRAVIILAHGLGMRVTAEGIEKESQAHALRQLECDLLQGFLLGMPISASDALRMVVPASVLEERRKRREQTKSFERIRSIV